MHPGPPSIPGTACASAPLRDLACCCLALCLGGCSIVSPWPLWELAKAGGATASLVIGAGPGVASDTVTHLHQPPKAVCIEYNPRTQVPDIVPALQTALQAHRVDSRVYESPAGLAPCPFWLRYSAHLDWDTPPFANDYRPYISTASLTLLTAAGRVVSSSHYRIDSPFGRSKWASTRDKLAPVVTALLASPDVAVATPAARQNQDVRTSPGPVRNSTP